MASQPRRVEVLLDDVQYAQLKGVTLPGRVRAPIPVDVGLGTEALRQEPRVKSLTAFSNTLQLNNFPTSSAKLPASGPDARGMRLFPYNQLVLPSPPVEGMDILPPDTYMFQTACGTKAIMGSFMGAFAGVAMGLFFGMMGDNTLRVEKGKEVPHAPVREMLRTSLKSTLSRSRTMAVQFGILTALFEGSECVVERYRGKHDVWNQMMSGCFSGGVMSAKAGPGAACLGCVGFAGFSVLIEKVMGPH